jgi:hypothetical protein
MEQESHSVIVGKRYAKKYILLIIAVLFILVLSGTYLLGYRLGPGLHVERVGTLTISGLPAGASIFVDQSLKGTSGKSDTMSDELVEGSHSIIVSEDGDYPWSTLALITSGKTTYISPILLSVKPKATSITSTSSRATALSAIASTTLPTLTHPLLLANGCTAVYVENNQVIAAATSTASAACTPPPYLCTNGICSPTIIFSPVAPLAFVGKYPGRQDALVVQFGATLFAIALDPRSPQFFAPVLTGTVPHIGTLSDGTVVVNDGKAVYSVQF